MKSDGFPMELHLKDGQLVELRPLSPSDEKELLAFFSRVPEEDRLYMEDDVTDPAVIRRWCAEADPERSFALVALDSRGAVVADGVLRMRKHGWQRHIGEILVTVDRAAQHRGLGTLLTRQLIAHAVDKGLAKVVTYSMAENQRRLGTLRALSFEEVGRLPGFIMDADGRLHDMVVMEIDAQALWDSMVELDFGEFSGMY